MSFATLPESGGALIHKTFCRICVMAALVGALLGCGGGKSDGDGSEGGDAQAAETVEVVLTNGRLYPAVRDVVMVEYNEAGKELQRSTASASDGSFQFTRRLKGNRIEAVYANSPSRVPPVYSLQLPANPLSLEVTPLTTWYDQLLQGGLSAEVATTEIRGLFEANCPQMAEALDAKYVVGTESMPSVAHDWLLSAAAAYLQSARRLGLAPKLDFAGWNSALQRHGDVLSQLCAFSNTLSSAAWSDQEADRLRRALQITDVDAGRLADVIAQARSQGLSLLALQIQSREFPDQTALLQATAGAAGAELALGSDFVLQQYALAQPTSVNALAASTQAVAQDATPSTDTTSMAITPGGDLVTALEHTTTVSGSATATARLVNTSAVDKTVNLAVNGHDMDALPGIIQQIVAMPVTYPGEPLYRKAWRYEMANKRNTQPLVLSFFQFQPDLWLRSVGSSYCEAQASVLYRIWTAMGYKARVYALTGHVTVEIFIDGRWRIFDPYLGLYYTDRHGEIVGVAELEKDPSLITNPHAPILPANNVAYSRKVANIFRSTEDNYIGTDYMNATEPEPLDNKVQIPAGGWLEVDANTNVMVDSRIAGSQVNMSTMRLWVPPGYTGTLRLPLLLLDVKGAGNVQLVEHVLDEAGAIIPNRGLAGLGGLDTSATDPYIHDLLKWFYGNDSSDLGVTEININESGADGLLLTLMVNPLYFKSQQQLTVRASGTDVSGLKFLSGLSS